MSDIIKLVIFMRRSDYFPIDLLIELREVVWPGKRVTPKQEATGVEHVPVQKDLGDLTRPKTEAGEANSATEELLFARRDRAVGAKQRLSVSPERERVPSIYQRTGVKHKRKSSSQEEGSLDVVSQDGSGGSNSKSPTTQSPNVLVRWRALHPSSKLSFVGQEQDSGQAAKAPKVGETDVVTKSARRALPDWLAKSIANGPSKCYLFYTQIIFIGYCFEFQEQRVTFFVSC